MNETALNDGDASWMLMRSAPGARLSWRKQSRCTASNPPAHWERVILSALGLHRTDTHRKPKRSATTSCRFEQLQTSPSLAFHV